MSQYALLANEPLKYATLKWINHNFWKKMRNNHTDAHKKEITWPDMDMCQGKPCTDLFGLVTQTTHI